METIQRLLEAAPSTVRKDRPIYEQFPYSSDICVAADAAQEHSTPEGLKGYALRFRGIVDKSGQVKACSVAELSFLVAQLGNPQAAYSVVETVVNEASFGINAPSLLGWILIRSINVQVQDWNTPVREFTYNRPPLADEEIYRSINQAEGRKQDGINPDSGLMCGFKDDIVSKAFIPKTGFIHFDLDLTPSEHKKRSEHLWILPYAPFSLSLSQSEHEAGLEKRQQKLMHPGDLTLPMGAQLAEHGIEKALDQYKSNVYNVRTEKAELKDSFSIDELHSSRIGVRGYDYWRGGVVVPSGSPKQR